MVFRERANLRWGGDLRRHHVLAALGARSDAVDVDGWTQDAVSGALAALPRRLWRSAPSVAAATMLATDTLDLIADRAKPFAVDFHDDPILQNDALGIDPGHTWRDRTTVRKRRNLDAFRWHIVPSPELADLAGLDKERCIEAGNGSDTQTIQPLPWPTEPVIGFISGAGPGRGIETLIDAVRAVRTERPDARLMMLLAATGTASEAYLAELRAKSAADDWIDFGTAPYGQINEHLGRAAVQCVPNPPAAYWDAVAPIKLFDAMASGRPVVVTPRTVMRGVVERHEAGLVAEGEGRDDLAAALLRLLGDEALARRLGANGRNAVVAEHDWTGISERLASRLVALSA